MSLLDEVKAIDKAWTDSYKNIYGFEEELDAAGLEIVDRTVEGTWRWGSIERVVVKKGNEYVGITSQEASGDGDTEWYPEFQNMRPITTVAYVKA